MLEQLKLLRGGGVQCVVSHFEGKRKIIWFSNNTTIKRRWGGGLSVFTLTQHSKILNGQKVVNCAANETYYKSQLAKPINLITGEMKVTGGWFWRGASRLVSVVLGLGVVS